MVQEALALAQTIGAQGSYRPVLYVPDPLSLGGLIDGSEEAIEIIDATGSWHSPEPGDRAIASRRLGRPARKPTFERLRAFILWLTRLLPPLRTVLLSLRLKKERNRLTSLLSKLQPVGIFAFDDRTVVPDMVLLDLAEQFGIPSVLVPFAASSKESDLYVRHGRKEYKVDEGAAWLKRIIARKRPSLVATATDGRYLFFSAWESLALIVAGYLRGDPWVLGGSYGSRRAVLGNDDRAAALRDGLPAEKLVVTGQPSLDFLYGARPEQPPASSATERSIQS